ncbi:Hypothetical predicted protein [Cloeon dipterum]|uniref:Uncharacterized protein n=1 Tax=Cloeon dipterum TaxID=197152 RepID=A0A8S1DJU1_9INSE|nr:Hypothetical predicted protein [Cloeon dipterum]
MEFEELYACPNNLFAVSIRAQHRQGERCLESPYDNNRKIHYINCDNFDQHFNFNIHLNKHLNKYFNKHFNKYFNNNYNNNNHNYDTTNYNNNHNYDTTNHNNNYNNYNNHNHNNNNNNNNHNYDTTNYNNHYDEISWVATSITGSLVNPRWCSEDSDYLLKDFTAVNPTLPGPGYDAIAMRLSDATLMYAKSTDLLWALCVL